MHGHIDVKKATDKIHQSSIIRLSEEEGQTNFLNLM